MKSKKQSRDSAHETPPTSNDMNNNTHATRPNDQMLKEVERGRLLLELYEKSHQYAEKQLYDFALECAVRLTDSAIGFFHLVSDDQASVILTTWNQEALKTCTAVYDNHYPIESAGNWVDCVRLKRPVIYNDFGQSPNRKGLPDGHSPVRRFMSIPVMEDGKVRIIFGVGNKVEEYNDHDVVHIQLVANELQKIIKQRHAEEALQKNEKDLQDAQRVGRLGSWDWDAATDTIRWSEEYYRIYGLDPKQSPPGYQDHLKAYTPESAGRLDAAVKHSMQTGEGYVLDLEQAFSDGTRGWITPRGEVKRDANGQITGLCGTAQHVAERKRAENEIARMNRTLRMLSDINQALIHTMNETVLLDKVCRIAVEIGGYHMAWVGFAEHDEAKTLRPVAHAGINSGYIESANVTWAENDRGRGPGGMAIRTGKPAIVRDIPTDPAFAPWQEAALQCGYKSIIALPLISEDNTLGALGIYSAETDVFDANEVEILKELADDLAFGITTLRLRVKRDKAEKALEHQYSTLYSIINSANAAIFSVDRHYRYTSFNNAHAALMKAIYGVEIEHQHSLLEYMTVAEDREKAKINIDRALAGERNIESAYSGEEKLSRRYFEVSHNPVFSENGPILGVVVFVQDITDRKHAEEALFEGQQVFRTLVENSPDIIARYDRDCRRTFINPVYLKEAQILREELLGTSPVQRSPLPASSAKLLQDILRRVLDTGVTEDIDVLWPRADNIKHWYNINAFPEYDREGKVVSVMTISRDITVRKQGEEEHLAHLKFLENLDQINRAMRETNDLDRMMNDSLNIVLTIFDCDRVWLLNPCDPDAFAFHVPMEISKPEYPGAKVLNVEVPISPSDARDMREALESDDPVIYVAGTERPINASAKQFGVQSQMFTPLYLKVGKPWMFGMHQCSYPRVWTLQDQKLFQEIGRRLADSLTSLLMMRDLRESEERYRLIAENTADTITVLDLDLAPVYVSPSVLKLRGYTVQEAMTQSLKQTLTPESLQVANNTFAEQMALEKGGKADPSRTVLLELEEACRDGSTIWVELAASFLRDANSKPTGILTVTRNITERKEAENEIKMLSAVVEQSTEGMAIAGLDGNLTFINEAWCKMHRYNSSDVLLGKNLAIFHNPEQMENEVIPFNKQVTELGAYSSEIGHITRGKPFLTLMTTILLKDKQGKPYALAGIARDITERKRVDTELRHLTHAIEQSPVSVVVTNTSGDIEYVNPKFTEITGYAKSEVLGKNTRILKSGETPPEEYKELWETITAGRVWHGEFHNKKKYGELFWESASISPVRDEKGLTTHFIAIKEDITSRKLRENELQQNEIKRNELERELIQAQKLESLGTLASGIAHDFNNILGIILGHSAMLQSPPLNPQKTSQGLDAIQKATLRGASLVKQLLTFARKSETVFVSVSINNIIEEVITLLRETLPKTITVSTDLLINGPSVIADATQIHQVFLNLCVNARDAMPRGGNLSILTSIVENEDIAMRFPKATAREYVRVTVSDTGMGMDIETQQKIFDPFFTTKGPGKGTGLGLALVHSIIESHNGMIAVDSAPGTGTTFTLYFPVEERPIETVQAPAERLADIRGGTETLLLIEDEDLLLTMVKAILVAKGYTVLTARDGEEGLDLFRRNQKQIAAVLSDLGLPKFGGDEVARRIKAIDPAAQIILASGFIDPDVKAEMLKIGVKRFIQKPYSLTEITQNVRGVLDAGE